MSASSRSQLTPLGVAITYCVEEVAVHRLVCHTAVQSYTFADFVLGKNPAASWELPSQGWDSRSAAGIVRHKVEFVPEETCAFVDQAWGAEP